MTLGRCNVALVGLNGAGHTVSRTYGYLADVEAGGIRDERGAQAEGGQVQPRSKVHSHPRETVAVSTLSHTIHCWLDHLSGFAPV